MNQRHRPQSALVKAAKAIGTAFGKVAALAGVPPTAPRPRKAKPLKKNRATAARRKRPAPATAHQPVKRKIGNSKQRPVKT